MTCALCGRYAAPDPATGYDADDVCPGCAADSEAGWHRHVLRNGIPSVRYRSSPKSRRLYKREDIDRFLEASRQAVEGGVRS